jgi:hypothetical protein
MQDGAVFAQHQDAAGRLLDREPEEAVNQIDVRVVAATGEGSVPEMRERWLGISWVVSPSVIKAFKLRELITSELGQTINRGQRHQVIRETP